MQLESEVNSSYLKWYNMALCTKCGNIMHEDDLATHVCATEEIPAKGSPIRPVKEIKDIKTVIDPIQKRVTAKILESSVESKHLGVSKHNKDGEYAEGYGIVLIDRTTGEKYRIIVTDGGILATEKVV